MSNVYTAWKGMVDNYQRMRQTTLELITHPDATDDQILLAARKLAEVRKSIISARPRVIEAIGDRGSNYHLSNAVRNTRI